MQRDFLNVLIMFLQAILLLLAPSMRTLHRSPPEPVSRSSYAHPKCRLSSPTVDQTNPSQQTHFITEIRNILTVCSAYHFESTFLSYAVVNFSVL